MSGDPCVLDTESDMAADTKTGGPAADSMASDATPMSPADAAAAAAAADGEDAFETDNFYAEDDANATGGAHSSAMGEAAAPRAMPAAAVAATVTKVTVETAPAPATGGGAGAPATGHCSGDGMKRPTGARCLTCKAEGSDFEYFYDGKNAGK